MLNNKKSWFLILLLVSSLLLVAIFSGCSDSTTPEPSEPDTSNEATEQKPGADWPKNLTVGCGPTSGDQYVKAGAWAGEMTKQLGIKITPESTAGDVVGIQMLQAGQVDIVTVGADPLYEGFNGVADWAEGKKLQKFRSVLSIDPYAIQFYTLKTSGIQSIYDIEGKSLNPSRAGTSIDTWARRFLEELEIKPSRIVNQAPSDANMQLSDGLLDVSAVQGPFPHPAITEAGALNDIKVFGFDKELADRFAEKYVALSVTECPPDTYKGQNEPFYTLGTYLVMAVREDLPEDLIYEFTKRTFENATRTSLEAAHAGFKYLDPAAINRVAIPLHKGAAKYYREIGIDIPEHVAPID
jgi:TRAP transporter TAXI family solute receptor